MTPWSAVVLALPEGEEDPMASRLPSYLHPVAGRPLIWHSVSALLGHEAAPERIVVVAPPEETTGLFDDLTVPVELVPLTALEDGHGVSLEPSGAPVAISHANTWMESDSLALLIDGSPGTWLEASTGGAAAAFLESEQAIEVLKRASTLGGRDALALGERLEAASAVYRVGNRSDLARLSLRVRDLLVEGLMDLGVTFLLPETVLVDVDVRIGRDSIVYPGVTIEGQTTVGQETVIGPGCRIMDSWIGSGVELKGWNYIAHTSVRNRAILEPYVRRGFD